MNAPPPARDALVLAHLGLVGAIARRYRGKGLGLDDLHQVGRLALTRAAAAFDPARDLKFTTFAGRLIGHDLCDAIRAEALARSVSPRMLRLFRAAPDALTAEQGRKLAKARRHVGTPPDLAADPAPPVAVACDRDDEMRRLRVALASIDPRLAAVATLRFGLDGTPPQTYAAIGAALGVSDSWAQALERRALAALREALGDAA